MTTNPMIYPESEYRLEIVPETLRDGRLIYVAWHPEIRRVRSQGDTPEEARENLSDAFALYVEHCKEHGFDMPAPQQPGVKEIIWRSFNTNPAQAPISVPQSLPSMGISQPITEPGVAAYKTKG